MSKSHAFLIASLGAALLAGCGKQTPQQAVQADSATAATELQAREMELARRESELAQREAALTAAPPSAASVDPAPASAPEPKVAAPAPKPKAVAKVTPKPRPAVVTTEPVKSAPVVLPPPPPITVPAGTQLPLALVGELSTKTAKIGDTLRAHVLRDVTVDGRVAIASGTTVAGQITSVVSGSEKIGGIPTLGMRFERLELPGGRDLPISGEVTQQGKSDRTRDTVKIVGGAAAGAILGNEIKGGDKGKIIGGLLGGAVGAVAAQKTGTEVRLVEGTELTITLAAPVEITSR
jgi:hypothetical protein